MYNHNNIVILLYNGYSCGKFLGNILSYNKNFVPQFPLDGNRHRFFSKETYDNFSLTELQELKHDSIMLTIPLPEETTNWWEYELGCKGFWGFWSGDMQKPINTKALWLLNQGIKCFFVTHTLRDYFEAKKKFPNAKTVKLINDKKINKLSKTLKLSKNNYNPPWIDLSTYQIDSIDFDIGSMFDKLNFFANIDQLLTNLTIIDKDLDPKVNIYYQNYCDLYKNLLK